MKLNTLYKKTKTGRVSYVQLYSRKLKNKDEYRLFTKTGIVGSEKFNISSILITEGKYIGKSNETNVRQQAHNELLSKYNAQFAKGYKENLEYVINSKYNTFKDHSVMPMLLNKYSTSKDIPNKIGQFKYDGARTIAEKHNGEIRLKSRRGNIYNIPHILNSVTDMFNNQLDITFDGELYCHSMALQDIISCVKNGDPNKRLSYVIYDIAVEGLTFEQRRNLLLAINTSKYDNIEIDCGIYLNNEEEVNEFYSNALEQNYEGVVICDGDSMYDFGFRSSSKTKIKPRTTSEFKCIDHYMNKGKYSKQSTLICLTEEGKRFSVKLKGNNEQRENWAANFEEEVKDKMITVEYRGLSNDNKPIEAVGIAIRDYE